MFVKVLLFCILTVSLIQTAFLITLTIVFNERVVNAQNANSADQMALAKNRAVNIVDGPKIDNSIQPTQPTKASKTNSPELRPPSKPPLHLTSDKKFYYDLPRHFYNSNQKFQAPPVHVYTKEPLKISNAVYKLTNTMPVQRGSVFYNNPTRPILPPSDTSPLAQSPKFSIPIQTINGIRTDFVKPPKNTTTRNVVVLSTTTTSTTTATPTTTQRVLRTKRIWPKRILEKINSYNSQNVKYSTEKLLKNDTANSTDLATSASHQHIRYAVTEKPVTSTTSQTTTRGYRRVTRTSKRKTTTTPTYESNDWIPIVPSHYTKPKKTTHYTKPKTTFQTPISKRSDIFLQPYGILPFGQSLQNSQAARKKMIFFRKKKHQLNPYLLNPDINSKMIYPQPQVDYSDPQQQGSQSDQKVVTKVHHHHHHHRYIKTVEKPIKVPYKVEVEVPKPYPVEKKVIVPVPVEKIKVVDRPYPVQVEKKIPYPVTVTVTQPVPVKVVEKEYVPKPYPVVHHVPIVKEVEVKVPQPVTVQVEKKVPYPIKVPYPVEKRIPVPYKVETKVPYPVQVKVFVPKPYPVEKKVPYPVEVKVKEPVEVIKHVQVKVPYPQPYPVKVPHPMPYTVEKRVPYPVQVEKKVPVPVEVFVPHKVEVEKKVPVYIPRPYPVEKRVPYPVKVPYPVRVPVKVPVQVPVRVPVRVPVEVPVYIHHPFQIVNDDVTGAGVGQYYADGAYVNNNYGETDGNLYRSETENATNTPQHTVTHHGNTGFNGFILRTDSEGTTAETAPKK